MILSNVEILQAIDAGRLVIAPTAAPPTDRHAGRGLPVSDHIG